MEAAEKSYRGILKATSLFGGVQIVQIIISMVRTKFVALFLGPAGVGILNLYTNPLGLITTITGFGISYSAIRDISSAGSSNDSRQLSNTLLSFRRIIWITGILGMLTTIVFSPWLSKWSFGEMTYMSGFIFLSITILLTAISTGQISLLQGLRKHKIMAKAAIIGSFLGLLISTPLYYLYGINGIVPSLIISAASSLIITWYYSKKVEFRKFPISYKESLLKGVDFAKLGIAFSVSSQIGALVRYLIILFISHYGDLTQVGLYTAGIGFMGTYVGLVFKAMSTDYYPKLAAINKDNFKLRDMSNQQAIISLLIIFPLVIFLFISLPLVTKIFLSEKFIAIIPFVNLTIIGVILKSVSYAIGYISFAKGDTKFFFWLEGIFSNALNLSLTIIGYRYFGLMGIGMAFILHYFIYLVLLSYLVRRRYGFIYQRDTVFIFSISFTTSIFAYILIQITNTWHLNLYLFVLFVFSSLYSFYELNKRLNLKPLIVKYKNKFLR